MNDPLKITSSHLARAAIVYLRQSSAAQVEHNRESTDRQYALVNKASDLGWPAGNVVVIDEDLGVSGAGGVARSGFARLTAEVALGHVGLVLGLEVSRLARNNADWYRLIDLCGLSNTLIGDADGVYHPALFNACLSGCNPQPLALVFGHAHGRSPAWRSSAPTIAPRVVNRGLRYAPQSFTPVPGSTLHLGGVGKNWIGKSHSSRSAAVMICLNDPSCSRADIY